MKDQKTKHLDAIKWIANERVSEKNIKSTRHLTWDYDDFQYNFTMSLLCDTRNFPFSLFFKKKIDIKGRLMLILY